MRLRSSLLRALSCGLLVFALSSTAFADPFVLSADGNAVVRIVGSSTAASSGFNSGLVTSAYSGWTVNKSSGPGSVSITTYDAGWKTATSGGGKLEASYSQPSDVSAGHTLNWVQVIDTNLPLGGSTSPYLDPRPNDDTLPFYWTTAEQAAKSTSKSVTFSDFSSRDSSSLASTNPITWNASLYPVDWDGNTTINVYDGVSWGWTMKPATVGSAAGTFVNPGPSCPPAVCAGAGTSTITWGLGESGLLSFAGSAFAPKVGDPFKLGTLTYHNGSTLIGTAIDSIGLDLALTFDNVPEANLVFHSALGIINTPNTNDPFASADFVSFTSGGFPATFHVLEGGTASVDLLGRLTPTLVVTPALASGDKDPDVAILPGAVGFSLQLVGFANPTTGGFVTTAPEPASVVLLGVGIAAGAFLRRRRGLEPM